MQARQPTSQPRLRGLPGRGACGREMSPAVFAGGEQPFGPSATSDRLESRRTLSRPAASRATRITAVGPGAHVLARAGDDPALIEGPGLLAATFHPEPAGDPAVHGHSLNRIRPAGAAACKSTSRRPDPA